MSQQLPLSANLLAFGIATVIAAASISGAKSASVVGKWVRCIMRWIIRGRSSEMYDEFVPSEISRRETFLGVWLFTVVLELLIFYNLPQHYLSAFPAF
jgi:hypothetical protein